MSSIVMCALMVVATACAGSASAPTAATGLNPTATPSPTPTPTPEPRRCLPAGLSDESIQLADGSLRTYRLSLPEGRQPDAPVPLVLDFHGATASAERQARVSNFETLAREEGFAVITGDGIDQRWSTSDVSFVDELLDDVLEPACIDTQRVFAAGMSNGGFFSAQLACELSDRIAAIGTVTGIRHPDGCSPSRPVPIVHFHGTADEIVEFDRIPGEIDEWVSALGCETEPIVLAMTAQIELRSFRSCNDSAAIDFYVIDGAGHTWPGSAETMRFASVLGSTNTEINATELIWKWFQLHPLSD